jgi:hypothetical protein
MKLFVSLQEKKRPVLIDFAINELQIYCKLVFAKKKYQRAQ